MLVGEHATARDVALHAETARTMLRYSGLSGRVRILLERLGALLGANEPPVGSRAWEARLELAKLPEIIRDRASRLAEPNLTAEQRENLITELHSLEAQVQEHASVVDSMNTDVGRGYVAAEGVVTGAEMARRRRLPAAEPGYYWRYRYGQLEYVARPGYGAREYNPRTRQFEPATSGRTPDVRFGDGATRREAYRELGGYDRSTDFGEYTHVLVDVAGITTHQEMIGLMQEPGGRMARTVRSNLKEIMNTRLLAYLRNPARLTGLEVYRQVLASTRSPQQALRAASHAEMVRITRQLEVQDRGAIAERWYRESFAPDATPQVGITRQQFPTLTEPRRNIDMMDDGTLRELKNVAGGLDPGDRRQVSDLIGLINSQVPVGGQPRRVQRVVVSFLDPLGARANAAFMRTTIAARPGVDVRFEIFNSRGERLEVSARNVDRLNEPALSRWLGLPTRVGAAP
jgi:hypothetical protein